jgi:hypothetical protein
MEEKQVINIEIKEENVEQSPYAEYLESDFKEDELIEESNEEEIENFQYENATKALSDIDSEIYNEPLSNISEATEEMSPNESFSKVKNYAVNNV